INTISIIFPQPFGALNPETQRIRPRRICIECNHNRLLVGCSDRTGNHITLLKLNLGIGMIFPAMIYYIFMKAPGFGCMRSQTEEAVPTIHIGHYGNWPYAMGRVHISVSMDGMKGTPTSLRNPFLSKFNANMRR